MTLDVAPNPPVNRRFTPLLLLTLILIVAAGLRAWKIDRTSFWLDEYLTVELSNGHGFAHLDLPSERLTRDPPDYIDLSQARSWSSIWTESYRDVHPPLFYLVLRGWRMVFPDSDASIRALSVVLSLVAIVMLYLGVSALSGPTPALWASLLMALAGPQIEFAQENRSYMLLLATLLSTAAALLRIERFGASRLRFIALGLSVFAAAMTHYGALTILGILGAYALIRLRGPQLRGALVAFSTAGIFYVVIWGPFAWAQMNGFAERISFTADLVPNESPLAVLWRVSVLPLRMLVNTLPRSQQVGCLAIGIYVLPLLLLRRRPELLVWWMWLAGGVGAVALSDLYRGAQGLAWIRYTLFAAPALYALAALMLSHLPGWSRHIVPLTLAVSCIAALEGAYNLDKPEWRELGEFIESHVGPDDVLVLCEMEPDLPWRIRCDFVGMNYYAGAVPGTTLIIHSPPTASIRQLLGTARRIWVFTPRSIGTAAGRLFPGSRVLKNHYVMGVGTLAEIQLTPPDHVPSSTQPAPLVLR